MVALMLTNTHAGTVNATDSKGNTYATAADQDDRGAGDRTLILSATTVKALSTRHNHRQLSVHRRTAPDRRRVDERQGGRPARLDDRRRRHRLQLRTNADHHRHPELVFGVAGVQGGAAAAWSSGFTALPTLFVADDQLATGYETVTAIGSYAAAGTCDHQWMAAVVAFAPSAPPR